MTQSRQCAILVGGAGTRLGALTTDTPKPLLDCAGRPFLSWILCELIRFGISDVVLLAGYRSEKIGVFCREVQTWLPKPFSIRISVEPYPAGTGGALWHARHLLDSRFLLINGDSWFDTNLSTAFTMPVQYPNAIGCVLLRAMEDCSRYASVELQGNSVVAFEEKKQSTIPGLINSGVYMFTHKVLEFLQPTCSLEKQILPSLAKAGLLTGKVLDGYFIDIGIPDDYARANRELPEFLNRRNAFDCMK